MRRTSSVSGVILGGSSVRSWLATCCNTARGWACVLVCFETHKRGLDSRDLLHLALRMNTGNAPLDHQVMGIPVIEGVYTNVFHLGIFMRFQQRVRDMLKCLVHRFLSCLPRMHAS